MGKREPPKRLGAFPKELKARVRRGQPRTARRVTASKIKTSGLDGTTCVERLQLIAMPVGNLQINPRNARRHTEAQIVTISASIAELGFNNPILADEDNMILAGHARYEAAKRSGITHVPVIVLRGLSQAQKRAVCLADNRLAELSKWDEELLKQELQELLKMDLTFDLEITGFSTADQDRLLQSVVSETQDRADLIPAPSKGATSRAGDLWQLGPHKLLCGDACEASAYSSLLGPDSAQMVFTDPPYNVPIEGHVVSQRGRKRREFVMASGEMSPEHYRTFLARAAQLMAGVSSDGAIHYICMDWRHAGDLLAATSGIYSELKNQCVWVKDNAGMGTFYRSQHELVFVFKVGTAPHVNNFGLGEKGRYRTNVWSYAGVSGFGATRVEASASGHPTVKPCALVVDAIKDCSRRGGIILDPFGGSGTTLIAAQRTGRVARLIELDPLYVDVIIKRWQAFTGKSAVHIASGQSFDALAQARAEESDDGV